jgi:hypothetical protein
MFTSRKILYLFCILKIEGMYETKTVSKNSNYKETNIISYGSVVMPFLSVLIVVGSLFNNTSSLNNNALHVPDVPDVPEIDEEVTYGERDIYLPKYQDAWRYQDRSIYNKEKEVLIPLSKELSTQLNQEKKQTGESLEIYETFKKNFENILISSLNSKDKLQNILQLTNDTYNRRLENPLIFKIPLDIFFKHAEKIICLLEQDGNTPHSTSIKYNIENLKIFIDILHVIKKSITDFDAIKLLNDEQYSLVFTRYYSSSPPYRRKIVHQSFKKEVVFDRRLRDVFPIRFIEYNLYHICKMLLDRCEKQLGKDEKEKDVIKDQEESEKMELQTYLSLPLKDRKTKALNDINTYTYDLFKYLNIMYFFCEILITLKDKSPSIKS